ncbi:MAG: phage integrase N-terminal SAM-like domain-containing protein [Verrucomicrobiota bacterium]
MNEVMLSDLRSLPAFVGLKDEKSRRSFFEFFTANIRNRNTREAYLRAIGPFFRWCHQSCLELAGVEPIHVAAYIELLGKRKAAPTVKQHLAAIRMLFDWLVIHQIVSFNPAAPVRGPRHVVKDGKSPVLSAEETRELIESIDIQTGVGLRDRALIGTMLYSFARVSAVCGMSVDDYYSQ